MKVLTSRMAQLFAVMNVKSHVVTISVNRIRSKIARATSVLTRRYLVQKIKIRLQ